MALQHMPGQQGHVRSLETSSLQMCMRFTGLKDMLHALLGVALVVALLHSTNQHSGCNISAVSGNKEA
jgi:hypothetical protein